LEPKPIALLGISRQTGPDSYNIIAPLLKHGRKFFQVAKRVAQKKSVIVLKTGRSKDSAKAAQSHTG